VPPARFTSRAMRSPAAQVREQVERRERDALQLDAAAPFVAQRLEHGQRGRRLGLHPVEVRAQRARARAPGVVNARSMRRRSDAPVQLSRCLFMRSMAANRLPCAAPTSCTV
jgi:hypothetical protein